ncbi:hypothetical protein NS331_02150 [Pseudacidovorax intermedius]|uniref:Uncharacterized protein n=1 Tax=Pseudacidovorax intermedius TaxID=433924 RepID=A0A147HBM6_9BURK|nr:hypothetical protein NS331_02150 [Pseudacidovorax intermedius]
MYSTLCTAIWNTRRTCGSPAMSCSACCMPLSMRSSGSTPTGSAAWRMPFSMGSVTRSIMALNRSALSLKCQ